MCLDINTLHTQQSVQALIFGFVCFQVPVAFRKEKHVCSEISQGCCAVRPPYRWFISQMGPPLPLLSPSVCSLLYDFSFPPPFLLPPPPLSSFWLMFPPFSLSSCSVPLSCFVLLISFLLSSLFYLSISSSLLHFAPCARNIICSKTQTKD